MVQTHCHHHASLDVDAEKKQLQRLNATVDWLDAGCCGMAGSFGFRASSYELSQTIAEQSLLPTVRAADDSTVLVPTGFSIRAQIRQGGARHPLPIPSGIQPHLAGP